MYYFIFSAWGTQMLSSSSSFVFRINAHPKEQMGSVPFWGELPAKADVSLLKS